MSYRGTVRAFEGPLAPEGCLMGRDLYDAFSSFVFARGYKLNMPRIPDEMMDAAVFQYRTVQEAAAHAKVGGTSFLVARPLKDSREVFGHLVSVPYLISNRHVVLEGSACVASVNRKDGGEPAILDIDQDDWYAHPGGDDLAATCVMELINHNVHKIPFVKEENFLTPAYIKEKHVGVGDEIFMIGRFVNLQGEKTNRQSVRFGSISMMLDQHRVEGSKHLQEAFAVEMRSRTGFSGSPVTIYRTPSTVLDEFPESANNFWCLLGVNYGYIPDENGENTWLNGVIPAWKITELLNAPKLVAIQAEYEVRLKELMKKNGAVKTSGATIAPATDENPTHLEDFKSLLTAAAKTPPQDD